MKTTLLFLSVFLSANIFGQNVYIPDANFKAVLVGNSAINTNGDTEIQVSEASAFGGAIICDNQSISNLSGIEAFTALTELNCDVNNLTSLDLSINTALTLLYCSNNQIASLDVFNNTALTSFGCQGNNLTSLDVSNNIALTLLSCNNNQLTSLDVSSNTALTFLSCSVNQLECLNVKNGNNTAFTFFKPDNNPNLTCIQVDDVTYSTANWTDIDSQVSFSNDCGNDCSSSLDITELNTIPKQLIKIVDVLGRETPFKPNTQLIYVYDDGSIEKVFSVEY